MFLVFFMVRKPCLIYFLLFLHKTAFKINSQQKKNIVWYFLFIVLITDKHLRVEKAEKIHKKRLENFDDE